ncbi:reductase [Tsukamurella pulmonis]|uniref:assimilatory sulfite reductase (NADPH) n=1 Tax=Tsukamurella pulmonis TaxID=47312 RepID=A0A1H1DEW2_9ACTN|nr:bifunctional nitrate reductase/sulfite reductase flavoprotein subunit alpha [Tsukamurella pulmonis]KXO92363.1 reductase [Tsukamurella pulmonis]SDQ74944.1 sulfite reductase [NADPH] flavoprotein, alpha-component [Tsukamurella pulmonis]SUP22137.1 Nitrate reductase [Tsukamurella pulmonis]
MDVETVCGYCGVGCGLTLQVRDGAVTGSVGTKHHPANRGRLCTKGTTTVDLLTAGGRQARAELREDRDGARGTVALEEAIAATGRRLRAIRDEHGPDAIALYVSGQMTLEAQYLATKLAKGFLRTQWIESNSRLCMASAGTGYKQSLGSDGPPGSYDDLDHADVFLVMGANMAECHPILFLRMMDRVKAGAKLIVVDPRRTATAAKADLHLAVRPGTDLALLNGLLALLVENNALDRDFIDAHTEGWDAMPAFLEDYPVERVAEITGLTADDITRAAELIGGAANWTSLWTMGLNQSTHGTWNTIALCNLHLATGAICRTGSGPFSLTGQPNAMGGREMGYMGPGLPGQRSVLDDADRAHTEALWGLPEGTIRTAAGQGTVQMYRDMAAGDIKAAWIICSNPVASMANRSTVIDALRSAEVVIVQDAYTGTETSAYADIVLPAALWSETDGVMVNSERCLTRTAAATPPPGEALPDWKLICLVAAELGHGADFDYPDAAAVFDEIKAFHNPRTGWDVRGVDHARLTRGPVQWPAAPDGPDRNPIRYLDPGAPARGPRFATPSGRARFLPRPYLPPAELPDDEYPMVLTTGRLAHQWHTMTKTGRVAKLNRLNPEPFLQVHPDDAAAHGLTAGTRVRVSSRRGGATLPVQVDDAVRPGVCFAPMHFADAFGEDVAVNAVTNDAVDPESLQPEFKVSAVALTPLPADPPPPVDVPASPLAAALAPYASGPGELSAEASGYLGGLLTGLSVAPPSGVPTVPGDAPLAPIARAWLEGVLAGVYGSAPAETDAPGPTVTVVWASQTGTAEGYAVDCAAALRSAGLTATVVGAEQIAPAQLSGTVVFLVATTGDGDAPDNGVALWDALAAAEPGDLDGLRYSVLGFGDPSYADFCGFARKLDARLEHLGAVRLAPRASCEPDYADTAASWLGAVVTALDPEASPAPPPAPEPAGYTRTRPLRTALVASERLSGDGSAKDVRRFTFALPADELSYRAGDALGIWPVNSGAVIEEFCARTGVDRDAVELDRKDLTRITPELLRFVADRCEHGDALRAVLDEPTSFAEWTWGRQLLDLLAAHPVHAEPAEWEALLRPLTPRLYSISSSPREDRDLVSITVSVVGFDCDGRRRGGACSTHLASLGEGDEVDVFVQPTRAFLPPEDPAIPVVMIGPGTGIAPFRGFLHERAHADAAGENWLFFGEQHEATDFYYRAELDALAAEGVLTRVDTAFSRDTARKVYVQDRMREHAAELWDWIRRGAHLYVCGDAARMARDVDEALRGIVAEHGHMAPRSADAYVAALSAEGRYVRDVY